MTDQRADVRPPQFSLRAMLVSTAIFAAVLGLTVWTDAPEIALGAAIVPLVLLLWRFTRANRAGLVFFAIGAYLLGDLAVDWIYRGDAWGAFMLAPFGSAALGIGAIAFLHTEIRNKDASAVHLTCAAAAFTLLVAWWVFVPPLGRPAAEKEWARKYAETMSTLRSLVQEIETIEATTGRYPKDENDWVAIRGAPVPETEFGVPFAYRSIGEEYELSFITGFFGGIHTYDSGTPERGVYKIPW